VNFRLPRIYPVTDARISGISHAEQVAKLIAGGAVMIQLREKYASPSEFYKSAEEALSIAKSHGVKIIINDRVDIAMALNADGVHLGQGDMPTGKARGLLGPNAIIGLSTHTVEQAREALKLPVDYIAIGPVFATKTKENPDTVVGLDVLAEVRNAVRDMPLVAIGGIDSQNLPLIYQNGADAAAVIGQIVSDAAGIEARIRELIQRSASKC